MKKRIWKLYFGSTIIIGEIGQITEYINKHQITDFRLVGVKK